MTTGLFTDMAGRFPLGARNGVLRPATEPISDTDSTPFGLSLRTAPTQRNTVPVRDEAGALRMGGTEKATTITSDGQGDYEDERWDVTDD